jgi:membrane-associated phospholipid phosphatase
VFRGWRNSGWLVGLLWLLTAAVLFSTLLIKQHVVLDLAAGGALGALSWWLQAPRVDKAPCRE